MNQERNPIMIESKGGEDAMFKRLRELEGYEKVVILICTSFSMLIFSLLIRQGL